jgi:hypothetical protein
MFGFECGLENLIVAGVCNLSWSRWQVLVLFNTVHNLSRSHALSADLLTAFRFACHATCSEPRQSVLSRSGVLL